MAGSLATGFTNRPPRRVPALSTTTVLVTDTFMTESER